MATHPPPPVYDVDRWRSELVAIADYLRSVPEPAVVVGDLNAGWFHPPFRRLLRDADLSDALLAAGERWAFTWPNDAGWTPRFVTLDHVLMSDRIGVADAWTYGVPGADHRGVTADVAIVSLR